MACKSKTILTTGVLPLALLGLLSLEGLCRSSDVALPEPGAEVHVMTVVGRGNNYQVRLAAIERLQPAVLSAADVEALVSWLEQSADDAVTRDELLSLQNDVAALLCKQSPLPASWPRKLVAMCQDNKRDSAWRDYCVQFMGQIYGKLAGGEAATVRETLWVATSNRTTAIAGTALIALADNVGKPGISRESVAQRASEICSSEGFSLEAKMTALQVASRCNASNAREMALRYLERGPALMKVSALAALGYVGGAADRQVILAYNDSDDVRIRAAARAALKKITQVEEGRN